MNNLCWEVFKKTGSIEAYLYLSDCKNLHEETDGLVKTTAKTITITSENPVTANVDGEIIYSDQFKIDANAGKIKVVKNNRVLNLIRKK